MLVLKTVMTQKKVCSSKYYDIEEMHNIEIPHKNKLLSLFHINAYSLNKSFDDLQHLLNCTKKIFDVIAISETRIIRNLTATISDHLHQVAIIPNMFGNISGNKSNIYERDWSKFDQEKFILDCFSVDWEDLLNIDELNADNSTKIYVDKINMLLDTYAPLKEINKYKLKFSS